MEDYPPYGKDRLQEPVRMKKVMLAKKLGPSDLPTSMASENVCSAIDVGICGIGYPQRWQITQS